MENVVEIVVLLIFVLLPVLSAVVKWIQERAEKNRPSEPTQRPVLKKKTRPAAPAEPEPEPVPVAVLEPSPTRPARPKRRTTAPLYKSLADQLESKEGRAGVREAEEKAIAEEEAKWEARRSRFAFDAHIGIDAAKEERARPKIRSLLPRTWKRSDLRRAVVMTEILGPPLALRAPGEGPFAPRIEN
jgi:hypothetical protein